MAESTGNVAVTKMTAHILGLVGALVVFFAMDKDFMALWPAWVAITAKPVVAFLTYAGITQVKAV